MKIIEGQPLPLGASVYGNTVNFSTAAPIEKECRLLLYKKGEAEPCESFLMHNSVGEVRHLAIEGMNPELYEYNFAIDGRIVADPYMRLAAGKDLWGETRDGQEHEIRGLIYQKAYDWEGDRPLSLPYHSIIAYSLHIRGFTKHPSSKVRKKGTFAGAVEKIPYLLELGINQIHCMPVYEFADWTWRRRNYWGYGEGFFFAPKSGYAAGNDAVRELKDMVKAFHKAGIEVVLEMPFAQDTPKQMMEECLRYYMMEFHIDGFILNPLTAPMEAVYADPILKRTKIMTHQLGFQTVMRRFLKGDEGMVNDVIYWLRHSSKKEGIFNSIAEHTGFTLHDLVSYDGKHNEANGENNQDGPDYNYSWNCGAEGPTRKKAVLELRKGQKYNAMFLVFLAQGTPCILSGDEFGNTQKGNNNVYCQDNQVSWVDWGRLDRERNLYEFVKGLIALRKVHPVFWPGEEMLGIDQKSCGIPDVSYHGESAWRVPSEVSSRQLGVYYSGEAVEGEDCFVAYNMHWLEHTFALPSLAKGKKWYRIASTAEGICKEAVLLEDQRSIELQARTIIVLAGR